MLIWWQSLPNFTLVAVLTRWMLGIIFTVAGIWKVFVLTPQVHAKSFFVDGFKDQWIPDFMLWGLGYSIPVLELAGGIALLVGLWCRFTTACVGMLLLLTTYGHALQQPLFDIDGHTFTRFVFVLILLALPKGVDQISLDYWLEKKRANDMTGALPTTNS